MEEGKGKEREKKAVESDETRTWLKGRFQQSGRKQQDIKGEKTVEIDGT